METILVQNEQFKGRDNLSFDLSILTGSMTGSTESPYYGNGKVGRITKIIPQKMTVKFFLQDYIPNGNGVIAPYGNFEDIDTNTFLSNYFINTDLTLFDDKASFVSYVKGAIVTQAVTLGYSTFVDTDILNIASALDNVALPSLSFNNTPARSIVTGTGATGFQPSSTRNTFASYNITITSTATIAGNASGTVVLEVAPTNSATPSDWLEVSRLTNGQSLSLALTLQSVQTIAGHLSGIVPAGYYVKVRSINNAGTPTYSYNSGLEVLL